MLTSLKTIYKIGPGPSSSHTMGPYKAALDFKGLIPNDKDINIEVILYGSLALTGKGHMTDAIIIKALSDYKTECKFDINTKTIHPNTMTFIAKKGFEVIKEETYISIGGGSVIKGGESFIEEKEVYDISNFAELREKLSQCDLVSYVKKHEGEDIVEYLTKALDEMFGCIERGLETKGFVAGKLKVKRVASDIIKTSESASDKDSFLLKLSAYAYAVAEENAAGGTIVTAPTCGSAGVLPAILYYLYKYENFSKEKLVEGLMIAGLVGDIVKHNATISGAVGGCQAEIGTATSMAAAALTYLEKENIDAIEYAAELAMEHSLGLTCDPVDGYVAIPCIERNAVGTMKAYEAYVMARFIGKARKNAISFDEVVKAMSETGNSLPIEYKETSLGGLAKVHKF